jgi:hypothetical protein
MKIELHGNRRARQHGIMCPFLPAVQASLTRRTDTRHKHYGVVMVSNPFYQKDRSRKSIAPQRLRERAAA